MTVLSQSDEERVGAIIDEVRETSNDPYTHYMMDELEETVENSGISSIDEWEPRELSTDDCIVTVH